MIEANVSSPKVITVCGSMKHWDEIQKVCARFTKMGYVVLSPYKINQEPGDDMEDIKHTLALGFEKKIDMSDMLFVVNKDGYIGESVQNEIDYAYRNHKKIEFLEVRDRAPIFTLCGSAKFKDEMNEYANKLRAAGKIVFTPETFNIDTSKFTDTDWDRWHHIHQHKMEISDVIIIFDQDGYVGNDTMREIHYAQMRGMRVDYYSRLKSLEEGR